MIHRRWVLLKLSVSIFNIFHQMSLTFNSIFLKLFYIVFLWLIWNKYSRISSIETQERLNFHDRTELFSEYIATHYIFTTISIFCSENAENNL